MSKRTLLAALGYVALAVADTALAAQPGKKARAARFVTKPLLMPTLATAFVGTTGGKGAMAGSTAAAQAFSWGGDVALLGTRENSFLAGLGSFFAGHVAYLAAFGSAMDRSNPLRNPGVRAAGAMALTTAPLMAYAAGREEPKLRRPVAAYGVVLASMFAASSMLDRRIPARARQMVVAGTGLFVVSDTILGARMFFVKKDVPALDAAVMATYTAGQGLIAAGVARAVSET